MAKFSLMRLRKRYPQIHQVLVAILSIIGDLACFLRYRKQGLRKYRLLHVRPDQVEWGFSTEWPSFHFGVVGANWDNCEIVPVEKAAGGMVGRCVLKVEMGKSWEDVGELEAQLSGKVDEGKIEKITSGFQKRFLTLDRLIEELKQTGELRTRKKLGVPHFREWLGIGLIIGQDGELILHSGHHRFGISLALNLKFIPVALVSVHPAFVKSGGWDEWISNERADFSQATKEMPGI